MKMDDTSFDLQYAYLAESYILSFLVFFVLFFSLLTIAVIVFVNGCYDCFM